MVALDHAVGTKLPTVCDPSSAPFVPGAPQILGMLLTFLSLSKALRSCLLGKHGFRGTKGQALRQRLCRKTTDR